MRGAGRVFAPGPSAKAQVAGRIGGADAVPATNNTLEFDGTDTVVVDNASDMNTSNQNQRTIDSRKQVIREEGGTNDGFTRSVFDVTLDATGYSSSNNAGQGPTPSPLEGRLGRTPPCPDCVVFH